VSSAAALPNLTPYQPSGWSDKIVVSKTAGTTTDSSPLYTTDTLYVDWAIINNGTTATAVRFWTELYVDGVLRNSWYSDPPVNAGSWQNVLDYAIGSLSAGTHTFKIKTDSTGVIAESDEGDNEYTKTIVVTLPNSSQLQNGTPVNNLSGSQGSQSFYRITVPTGQGRLDISTAGGTGDCDLYVKFGSPPTTSSYGYSSTSFGNADAVRVNNPTAGDWYVLLYASSAYSGAALTAGYGTADLTTATGSISRTAVAAGEPVTVTLSVINQGSAASDATQIYFYFRSNPSDYSSGAWVGQISLAALNPGAMAAGLQFTYVLPLNRPAGTYALSYWIDAPGSVAESDESNNTGTWTGIAVSSAPVQQLANAVPLSGQSGAEGSQKLYKITVPAGQGRLDISTAGGTGDCDLYVKFDSPPTTSSYGYHSAGSDNNEAVGIYNPSAGD
jgi:subtilase family serine protease